MPTLGGRARWYVLAVLTAIVVALVAWVALRGKQLGPVASATLQGIGVALSVYGGTVFISEGNDKHVRAAARASVRRVLVNYSILGRLATAIAELRPLLRIRAEDKGLLDPDLVDMALSGLQDQISNQILSADAAIQDWRDLASVEVDDEVSQVRERQNLNG